MKISQNPFANMDRCISWICHSILNVFIVIFYWKVGFSKSGFLGSTKYTISGYVTKSKCFRFVVLRTWKNSKITCKTTTFWKEVVKTFQNVILKNFENNKTKTLTFSHINWYCKFRTTKKSNFWKTNFWKTNF